MPTPDESDAARLLAPTTRALGAMHRHQIRREPWPDFDAFDPGAYPRELRRHAAWHWVSRAQAEHGSVHQFSAVTHALCEARAPVELLGALARLITDEVRHVELCGQAALAFFPEGGGDGRLFAWRTPRAPWPDAPEPPGRDVDAETREARELALRGWASRAILTACCLGETLSKPMLDALAVVATDPVARACAEQILKDERFHASFGWEALEVLWPTLDAGEREALQRQLARSLAGFERTTCGGVTIEDVANTAIEIGPSEEPNLGTLTNEQFAMIFFATLEAEIFPKLRALGLDPERAWRERGARAKGDGAKGDGAEDHRPEAAAETRADTAGGADAAE
ncbi:MAG TPA: hypothetical protein RMH85_16595 [Polyangiaceae bacterium LLY-WYZ-15_(1-7)]|nr:hypothetical protein [Sandaracinus sp.]HJL01291.1 hypothetical protein [Polyangiaceae bacterium LLY-WYZ-15_(1-7)]MBJ72435.1 hypothetical protein [Sandaracinus sp.]HJL10121.1 hypothetical protein [Polyangiaceae bacterium LLY-WYZ-15_(1-7)]HJL21026.1 hypothetical protein [Polyangiaceae bacterium LLY-WYZ-15_(1-7)]